MIGCERVIVLIDMDCFYVQVEQRRQPEIKGKPCAVVQYNQWKGGGIIAVSYEARAKGVSRNMRGDDAKEKCPDIILCMVPTANGKADLTRYRDAGAEVIQVLLQFSGIVERASIDEAYIDLTEVVDERMTASKSAKLIPSLSELQHTYVVGYPHKKVENDLKSDTQRLSLTEYNNQSKTHVNSSRLLIAAALVEEIRLAVYMQTSFRCSAGISHNKVLAKLACGINKPNKQTVLPMESVPKLFDEIKIGKIRNLGGKLGQQIVESYGIEFIGQLTKISKSDLLKSHGIKTGEWLYDICRGIDWEPVKERHVAQSVGCSKTFRGAEALNTRSKVKHWVDCLTTELVERLTKDELVNNRTSTGLTAHIGLQDHKPVSRSCHINKYDLTDISNSILTTLDQLNQNSDKQSDTWYPAITMIGVSAGKFKDSDDKMQHKLKLVPKKKETQSTTVTDELAANNQSVDVTSHYFRASTMCTTHSTIDSNPNSLLLTASKEGNSKKMKQSNIDKKRLFFNQNFGSAKPVRRDELPQPITDTMEEIRKTISPVKKKTVENVIEKKKSFFAKMKEKSRKDNDLHVCKIENAFNELTNFEDTETEVKSNIAQDSSKDKLSATNSNEEIISATHSKQHVKDNGLQMQKSSSVEVSYDMNEIDMEVFNSLPLYLQEEIKSASRKNSSSTSASSSTNPVTKRRRLAVSSGQNSIAEFFNPQTVDVASRFSPSKKVNGKKNKSRKGTIQFSSLEENSVPFGFFRARTQASAAIRNAVEQQLLQSQKRKTAVDLKGTAASDFL